MVRSRRWSRSVGRFLLSTIRHQEFPLIGGILKRIQVEGQKVIEEVALDLAAKNVDLGTENV